MENQQTKRPTGQKSGFRKSKMADNIGFLICIPKNICLFVGIQIFWINMSFCSVNFRLSSTYFIKNINIANVNLKSFSFGVFKGLDVPVSN